MTHGRASQQIQSSIFLRFRRLCLSLSLTSLLFLSPLLLAAPPAGKVVAWAWSGAIQNSYPTNPFAGLSNIVTVSAASGTYGFSAYTLALLSDGTVRGHAIEPQFAFQAPSTNIPPGLSNVVRISAAPYAALAVRSDGTVAAWGGDNPRASLLTTLPDGLTNIVDIVGTYDAAFALRSDGTLVAWGERVATNTPAGMTNIAKICTDSLAAIGLLSNGTVVTWGHPSLTNFPPGLTNVTDVSVGFRCAYAVKKDGTVLTWGDDVSASFPTNLTNVVRVFGRETGGVALCHDGSLVGWPPSVPVGLSNVIAVGLGPHHTVVLVIDPQITAIKRANQQADVRFPTFSGQQYTVESSPNLSPGSWTNLTTIPGTGHEATFTDTNIAGSVRFYRLRQP